MLEHANVSKRATNTSHGHPITYGNTLFFACLLSPYTHTCTHTGTHVHTCTHMCTHTHTCAHTPTHAYTQKRSYVHTHVCSHTRAHTRARAHMQFSPTYNHSMHAALDHKYLYVALQFVIILVNACITFHHMTDPHLLNQLCGWAFCAVFTAMKSALQMGPWPVCQGGAHPGPPGRR